MDEPLGALDKQLRARLQYEIKRIQQQIGITVVYVTHDQEEALVMSDRIGVMNHGRLLQVGSPTDLYDRPVNTFVASFIGETNFIPGHIEQIEADHAVIFAAGQRIVTRAPDDLDRGSAITLAVRPEKITLTKPDGPCPEDYNKLAATVEQRFFIGESHRYGLLLADGSRIEVKQQNAADQAVLEPGDRADAIWHRDDLRVFRPEAEDRH
jgi:ABC-type Fe3+/spermidine/putrescine transport system ATPase subunit